MVTASPLYWFGPRRSDIAGIENTFDGFAVLTGGVDTSRWSRSLQIQAGRRFNLNAMENSSLFSDFYADAIAEIAGKRPDAKLLWYGNLSDKLASLAAPLSPYLNSPSTLSLLNDKLHCRSMMSHHTTVDGIVYRAGQDLAFKALCEELGAAHGLVVQEPVGFGGFQTRVVRDQSDLRLCSRNQAYLVAPFHPRAIPINFHVFIGEGDVRVSAPSLQVVDERDGLLLFFGCDFGAIRHIPTALLDTAAEAATSVAHVLCGLGYRGVAGIDFLVDSGRCLFLEVNPRFQASTPSLNRVLATMGLPSAQELSIRCFEGVEVPPLDREAAAPFSLFTAVHQGHSLRIPKDGSQVFVSPDTRQNAYNQASARYTVDTDGLGPDIAVDPYGHIAKIHLDDDIVGLLADGRPRIQPVLKAVGQRFDTLAPKGRKDFDRLARLKFTLFSYGMRLADSARERILAERRALTVRDGIAGGLELRLYEDIYINVPVKEAFCSLSPFTLEWSSAEGPVLLADGEPIIDCHILPQQLSFEGTQGRQGVPDEIGHLTTDRLGLFPFRGCRYTATAGTQCEFCEISYMRPNKPVPLEDVAALVKKCDQEVSAMRHILISGGAATGSTWSRYVEFARTVRASTQKPIYQMIEPPPHLSDLQRLHDAGVNEIAVNIEIFDRTLARQYMKGKGQIPLETYLKTLEAAVEIWGNKGAVRSILIVGLEPVASTLAAVDALTQRGVLPILSPFRPVPGTGLQYVPPAGPEEMYELWTKGQEISERNGMTLGPLCVACQNNTITLPVNDHYRHY